MTSPEPLRLETCSVLMSFGTANLPVALGLLQTAARSIKLRCGCLSCRIERDGENKYLIRYTEEWDDADAFLRHIRSDEFFPVLIAMDLASREPDVVIASITGQRGLGVLEALRLGRSEGDENKDRPGSEGEGPPHRFSVKEGEGQ